jgi:hypothetical protein
MILFNVKKQNIVNIKLSINIILILFMIVIKSNFIFIFHETVINMIKIATIARNSGLNQTYKPINMPLSIAALFLN